PPAPAAPAPVLSGDGEPTDPAAPPFIPAVSPALLPPFLHAPSDTSAAAVSTAVMLLFIRASSGTSKLGGRDVQGACCQQAACCARMRSHAFACVRMPSHDRLDFRSAHRADSS